MSQPCVMVFVDSFFSYIYATHIRCLVLFRTVFKSLMHAVRYRSSSETLIYRISVHRRGGQTDLSHVRYM